MRQILFILLILFCSTLTSRLPAQITGHAAVGVGVRPSAGGVTEAAAGHVAIGVNSRRLSFRVRLMDVTTITTSVDTARGSSGRYYWDTFSNGQRRCRDSRTGRFASNSLCSSGSNDTTNETFKEHIGTSGEVAFAILSGRPTVSVGGGVRVGAAVLPYGLVQGSWAPNNRGHLYLVTLIGNRDISGYELGYSFRVWQAK